MQLSKLEHNAYQTLKLNSLSIFTIKDLRLLLNIDRMKAYNLVKALKSKKAITTIKSGLYGLQGTDDFILGAHLNWPSYLSFWSALSYYHFTDQMPRTIFYATTKYRKRQNNYRYIVISKHRFFGYTRINDIVIADKEKAIIDSLLFPKYAGGIKEVTSCIRVGLNELNTNKIVKYAKNMRSKVLLRRLGYILESLGYKDLKIKEHLGSGYGLLDPCLKKSNNFNKEWLLDINYDINR